MIFSIFRRHKSSDKIKEIPSLHSEVFDVIVEKLGKDAVDEVKSMVLLDSDKYKVGDVIKYFTDKLGDEADFLVSYIFSELVFGSKAGNETVEGVLNKIRNIAKKLIIFSKVVVNCNIVKDVDSEILDLANKIASGEIDVKDLTISDVSRLSKFKYSLQKTIVEWTNAENTVTIDVLEDSVVHMVKDTMSIILRLTSKVPSVDGIENNVYEIKVTKSTSYKEICKKLAEYNFNVAFNKEEWEEFKITSIVSADRVDTTMVDEEDYEFLYHLISYAMSPNRIREKIKVDGKLVEVVWIENSILRDFYANNYKTSKKVPVQRIRKYLKENYGLALLKPGRKGGSRTSALIYEKVREYAEYFGIVASKNKEEEIMDVLTSGDGVIHVKNEKEFEEMLEKMKNEQ